MNFKISPSVLACDLSRLAEETCAIFEAGAHMVHLDVMDGHFVPNITFGAPVIQSLREKSPIFFDTHLMISEPLKYIKDFALAGSDMITFHLEASDNPFEVIEAIRAEGKKAGISIKPNTPSEEVFKYLPYVDMVLIMSVEPGFGGQKFMESAVEKISAVREEANRLNLHLDIEVDGGIDDTTVGKVAKAGANVFVAGSYIFKNDYKSAISALMKKAEESSEHLQN